MISTRYHLFTVISIFLALGIGILLGGSLGQQWLSEKQQTLMDQLERHYDKQLAENRKLSADIKKLHQAYTDEKSKTDDLLQITVGNVLHNRYLIVFSADKQRAARLEKMIQWAGGQVQVLDSLKYFPADADGVILLGDDFTDQVSGDLLRDLQLMYQAPVIVHTTQPFRDWGLHGIYTFNGPMSETLAEYRFLKYVGKIIPPYEERRHEA